MQFIKITIIRNGHVQNLSVLEVSVAVIAPLFSGLLHPIM